MTAVVIPADMDTWLINKPGFIRAATYLGPNGVERLDLRCSNMLHKATCDWYQPVARWLERDHVVISRVTNPPEPDLKGGFLGSHERVVYEAVR